jgi:hypothetical protein
MQQYEGTLRGNRRRTEKDGGGIRSVSFLIASFS